MDMRAGGIKQGQREVMQQQGCTAFFFAPWSGSVKPGARGLHRGACARRAEAGLTHGLAPLGLDRAFLGMRLEPAMVMPGIRALRLIDSGVQILAGHRAATFRHLFGTGDCIALGILAAAPQGFLPRGVIV